jgi:hypothetical protein
VINAIIIIVGMIIKWNSSKKNMVLNTGNNILDESLLRATMHYSLFVVILELFFIFSFLYLVIL